MRERQTEGERKIKYDLMVTMKPQFHRQEKESNTYCIGSSQGVSTTVGIEHLAHFIYHCHHYLLRDVFETTHLNPSSLFWHPQTLHVSTEIPRKPSTMPQFLQKHLTPYFVSLTRKIGVTQGNFLPSHHSMGSKDLPVQESLGRIPVSLF